MRISSEVSQVIEQEASFRGKLITVRPIAPFLASVALDGRVVANFDAPRSMMIVEALGLSVVGRWSVRATEYGEEPVILGATDFFPVFEPAGKVGRMGRRILRLPLAPACWRIPAGKGCTVELVRLDRFKGTPSDVVVQLFAYDVAVRPAAFC